MEKINEFFSILRLKIKEAVDKVKKIFVNQESQLTHKKELNLKNITILFFSTVAVFLIVGLFMPSEDQRVFRQVAKESTERSTSNTDLSSDSTNDKTTAQKVWGNGGSISNSRGGGNSQINYNTAMVMGGSKSNAKFEINAGTRMRIQIIEKFVASQEGTPVVAKLLDDVTSASGSSIPEGSLLYGEASYQKASSKAVIQFKKVSYPNGSLHDIAARVLGSDGMAGLEGDVKSDSVKNSIGQTITGFVGTLASGSMEKDFMGNSKGGNTNGLYQAISETAKAQAQKYGESMKESREWIEVQAGALCEAVILDTYKLIDLDSSDGGSHE